MLSKEEFEALPPRLRGYTVYMAGNRDDQPNVPDEKNPYPEGTHSHAQWNRGQMDAVIEVTDAEE